METNTTLSDIKGFIVKTGDAFDEFKKTHGAEQAALRDRIEEIEAKGMNPNVGTKSGGEPVRYLKSQSGEQLPMLSKSQRFADLRRADKGEPFNLGDYCRAALMGSEAKTASGAALVPTGVSATIIDLIRAQATVVRAGANTILIDGPANMARLTQDASVYQHTEAAADIVESDILAEAVSLNPKLLAALVPLTVELVQDSPNLDALLQQALAAAFAAKLDALAIAAIIGDAATPKSAAAHDPATWVGTNAAIAVALGLNQDVPTAHISTAANYAARSVILASTAGSWLGKPPYLSGMQELFSTAMGADTAIFGDFSQGIAMVLRSQLTLEVIRHGKPTSGSHLLVAHARVAPVLLQPKRLFWQKKTP